MKGAASCPASLLCPPLHSPAHRVPGLQMVSLAILGSLCQQRRVVTATAVMRCGAGTCSGVEIQQSSVKGLGQCGGMLWSFHGPVGARQATV